MKALYSSILLLLLLTSCDTIYHPSSISTANLEKKGDMELQATGRKSSLNSKGGSFNLGYTQAFTDKYATIVNIEYQKETLHLSSWWDSKLFENQLAEFYLGRYFSNVHSNMALFVGAGRGYQDKLYEVYWGHKARYVSDFIQASILFKHTLKNPDRETQKFFFTYFCRINYIHNYNIEVHLEHHYYYQELLSHKNMLSVEPGMTLRRNFGKVGLFLQGVFAFNPEDIYNKFTGNDEFMTTRPVFLMGISYNLNHKKHLISSRQLLY